ncbi:sigma-70 region 4 domain-containing protein [Sphingopyxis sp.]|jgi:RNA polymerase sigma-70 factor (ECF subfamily)|uniref:sigma-70 region 4 domain-containing protein n=1 Tax=Sphingopyxis sp. TaxID=1908224 RepID=UPI002E04B505|nr:sigma-70 region 4 domain-containing protein [Sphingopyxis sp.]
MRAPGDDRLDLRRVERAARRMSNLERRVFLAIRVDEMSYAEVATELGISIAEVEQNFAASLDVLVRAVEQKDPWWWRFWPR